MQILIDIYFAMGDVLRYCGIPIEDRQLVLPVMKNIVHA
jgi:hypothetical protein